MLREHQTVYVDGEKQERLAKITEHTDTYFKQIKRELNRIHDMIIYITGDVHAKRRSMSPAEQKKLRELEEEQQFWQNEIAKFDNNISHKRLKRHTRKLPYAKLYDAVMEQIRQTKAEGFSSLSKENIAIALCVKTKDLDKVFMQMNREGILSQAVHKLPHDSNRWEGALESREYKFTDWGSDYYTIRI